MEDINDRDKRSSEGTHDLWREFNATERTDTTTSVALVRVPEDGAELVPRSTLRPRPPRRAARPLLHRHVVHPRRPRLPHRCESGLTTE